MMQQHDAQHEESLGCPWHIDVRWFNGRTGNDHMTSAGGPTLDATVDEVKKILNVLHDQSFELSTDAQSKNDTHDTFRYCLAVLLGAMALAFYLVLYGLLAAAWLQSIGLPGYSGVCAILSIPVAAYFVRLGSVR